MSLNTLFHKVGIMIYKTITKMQKTRSDKTVDKAALENKFAIIDTETE